MLRNKSSISATPRQANLASIAPDLSHGRASGDANPILSANPQRGPDSRIETQYVQAGERVQPSPLLENGEPRHIHNNRASQILET
jgi:hypothetical protein